MLSSPAMSWLDLGPSRLERPSRDFGDWLFNTSKSQACFRVVSTDGLDQSSHPAGMLERSTLAYCASSVMVTPVLWILPNCLR